MPGHLPTHRQQFAERIKPIDKDKLRRQCINAAAILGGAWALLSMIVAVLPGGEAADPTPGNSSIPSATLVSGFAAEYVKTYLTTKSGDEQKLARYVTLKDNISLPAVTAEFTDVEVNFVKQTLTDSSGLSVWTATVSGLVNGDTAAKPPRTYYRVTVTVLDSSPRAVGRPMVVEAPAVGVDVRLDYRNEVRPDSPLGESAAGFVRAYLTGGNDLSRFITSDSKDKAVRPTPYRTVDILSIHADVSGDSIAQGTANAMVTFVARAKNNTLTQLSAPLTLRAVEGRWQVESLNATPDLDLRPEDPRDSTPTTTTPTTDAPPATRG